MSRGRGRKRKAVPPDLGARLDELARKLRALPADRLAAFERWAEDEAAREGGADDGGEDDGEAEAQG